jgi:hypothetical protein
MPIISCATYNTGLYGVICDVREGGNELAERSYHDALEAVVPYVPDIPEDLVVRGSKYTENPLHDPRKALAVAWPDQKMDMIAHDAEIADGKRVLVLSPMNDIEHKSFHLGSAENELPAIRPRYHVVFSAGYKRSWFSHTLKTFQIRMALYETKHACLRPSR